VQAPMELRHGTLFGQRKLDDRPTDLRDLDEAAPHGQIYTCVKEIT
jgi:hypothetical protein